MTDDECHAKGLMTPSEIIEKGLPPYEIVCGHDPYWTYDDVTLTDEEFALYKAGNDHNSLRSN